MSSRPLYLSSSEQQYFKKAAFIEASNPELAMEYFRRLEKANKTKFLDATVTGVIGIPLSLAVAYYLYPRISQLGDILGAIIAVLLMIAIGHFPPLLIAEYHGSKWVRWRYHKDSEHNRPVSWGRLIAFSFGEAAFAYFLDLLKAIVSVAAGIAYLLPVIGLYYLGHFLVAGAWPRFPDWLGVPIIVVGFIMVFSHVMVDIWPVNTLPKRLMLGLAANLDEISQFLLTLGMLALPISIGSWQEPWNEEIAGTLLAGLFFGLFLYNEQEDYDLEAFIRLGKSRCHIHMRRIFRANVEIQKVLDFHNGPNGKVPIKYFAWSTREYIDSKTIVLDDYLTQLLRTGNKEAIDLAEHYPCAWEGAVLAYSALPLTTQEEKTRQ